MFGRREGMSLTNVDGFMTNGNPIVELLNKKINKADIKQSSLWHENKTIRI